MPSARHGRSLTPHRANRKSASSSGRHSHRPASALPHARCPARLPPPPSPGSGPLCSKRTHLPAAFRPAAFSDVGTPPEPVPHRHRLERARAGPAHRPSPDPGAPLDQGREPDPFTRRRLDHRARRFHRGPSGTAPRQRAFGHFRPLTARISTTKPIAPHHPSWATSRACGPFAISAPSTQNTAPATNQGSPGGPRSEPTRPAQDRSRPERDASRKPLAGHGGQPAALSAAAGYSRSPGGHSTSSPARSARRERFC